MATDNTIVSYFTNAGQALATEVQAGTTKLTFTKAEASNTNHSSDSTDTLAQITALDSVKQTAEIGAVLILNKNTVQVSIDFNQNEITDDYDLWTIGLFAKSDTGDEILYSVTPLEHSQYMYSDTSGSTLTINLNTAVGQAASVNVVVSQAGSVTSAQLTATLQSYDTSAQVNNKIAAIPKPDLTAYDTSKQVSDKIAAIPKPDLTPYANKTANNEYTGTNNFDTVPTVNNNPLLLASSLPSDLARTGSDQEFTGKNTFDTAPIDQTTGNPYITKDGSAKLVIASGEDVDAKLKAIISTKDTGKLLVDINAKNNPTGHSLIGEYFCDFDGLVTGYGIGPDGAMWNFTYNGTTTIWKWIITAKTPGIPKLSVKYSATSKAFDYTLTVPEKDGLSDIIQYNLLWKGHSVDDWTTVIVKPDALTGQLTGVDITKTYDFKAAAQNAVGSSDSTDVITLDGNIYGASWDGSSSGVLKRTDAAVGLKAGINGAQNDFDTRGPWGLMDKTVTDSLGNAFVRVPKFYIRKTQDKPLSTWQVSLVKQGDDWYLPNCFYDFDNKKELDYVDVSRYEGFIESGHLKSKSGVNPTDNVDINDFRTAATALNVDGKKGYHLWDVHTLDALQVLFTIEFATLDSQSIMEGNDNSSSAIGNGTTDNVKGSSGFAARGSAPMTYRGIENLYGNLSMWTDGLNIRNLSLYACDDATKYASDVFTSPYYKLNYSLQSMNSNITGLGFDKDHPSVEAPTSSNDDQYNTYYHDYCYVSGSGNFVVYTGGGWDWDAGVSGLWCWHGYGSSTYVRSAVGSRLLKKAL